MAANTLSSNTGTVTGTDASFVLTYKTNASEGVVLFLKYTQGSETDITLTFDTVNPSLHATDKFRHVALSGTSLDAYTMVISASGNYRIPIPVIPSEKEAISNITFSSADQGGAVVANFMEV